MLYSQTAICYICESKGIQFAITGSSAQKLKRSHANLLAGRAIRCDFFPFVFAEIADFASISECIEYGTLPPVVSDGVHAVETLSANVDTYLKEEIAAEAIVRQLEPFVRFLRIAAQNHAQHLNVESVAREWAVKRRTVDSYFAILEETLLGFRLPALSLKWRGTFQSLPQESANQHSKKQLTLRSAHLPKPLP